MKSEIKHKNLFTLKYDFKKKFHAWFFLFFNLIIDLIYELNIIYTNFNLLKSYFLVYVSFFLSTWFCLLFLTHCKDFAFYSSFLNDSVPFFNIEIKSLGPPLKFWYSGKYFKNT